MSNPDESNFMLAAEKSIAQLKNEVEEGRKAARKSTIWNVILSVVSVITLAVAVFSVQLYSQQRSATSQLRSQAIASCETGNDRAAGTVVALDQLVNLLEGPHPTPEIQQVATSYKEFVAQHNAARNCQKAYNAGQ